MLQHDRHFVRIELAHPRRKPHAPRMGAKTDVKVMLSRDPIARHTGKDFPHGPAQGVLDKKIVSDQVSRHSARTTRFWTKFPTQNIKRDTRSAIVEASVARCLRTPP